MIYVTEAMIEEIYTKQDEDTKLLQFIIAAEQITNQISDYVIEKDLILDLANITEVQRFLSAHFATNQEKVTKSESVSGVGESYDLSTDLYLTNSHYGQTAIAIDKTGFLAELQARLKKGEIKPLSPYLYNL